MIDISREKALKKTLIEIESDYMDKVYSELTPKIKEAFVPPLFDEYTVKVTQKAGVKNFYKRNLAFTDKNFFNLTTKEQDKTVNSILIKAGLSDDAEEIIYVKYASATELTIIYFDGYTNKKMLAIDVACGVNDCDKIEYWYDIRRFSNRGTYDQVKRIAEYNLTRVFVISYFMQHHNQFIEYDKIDVGELKKQSNSAENKQSNKGYAQKIKLKSKINKYIISEEYTSKRKTYNKIKACWYVRGYYQHFGRDKILKYIPPRINYRAEEKLKKCSKPKGNMYELVDK